LTTNLKQEGAMPEAFKAYGDSPETGTPSRWIDLPGGAPLNSNPRSKRGEKPVNMAPSEKPLEEFLKGELKPIQCRSLGGEDYACKEMSVGEDGSKNWLDAPGVAGVNQPANAGGPYRQMHYIADDEQGARSSSSTLRDLTAKLEVQPASGLTLDKFPTKISSLI
jgi:hypothetical protein